MLLAACLELALFPRPYNGTEMTVNHGPVEEQQYNQQAYLLKGLIFLEFDLIAKLIPPMADRCFSC